MQRNTDFFFFKSATAVEIMALNTADRNISYYFFVIKNILCALQPWECETAYMRHNSAH